MCGCCGDCDACTVVCVACVCAVRVCWCAFVYAERVCWCKVQGNAGVGDGCGAVVSAGHVGGIYTWFRYCV